MQLQRTAWWAQWSPGRPCKDCKDGADAATGGVYLLRSRLSNSLETCCTALGLGYCILYVAAMTHVLWFHKQAYIYASDLCTISASNAPCISLSFCLLFAVNIPTNVKSNAFFSNTALANDFADVITSCDEISCTSFNTKLSSKSKLVLLAQMDGL